MTGSGLGDVCAVHGSLDCHEKVDQHSNAEYDTIACRGSKNTVFLVFRDFGTQNRPQKRVLREKLVLVESCSGLGTCTGAHGAIFA